ncbi:MAG: hypothetical protein AAFO07_07735, partial [Bacteroidota bacterium]
NMALLGSIIFIFIALHMAHFWFKFKFGWIDANHANYSHYDVIVEGFQQPWIVVMYVLAQIALAYHLIHGFQSAFQTLGLRFGKYTSWVRTSGVVFSIVVPLLFALIPIFVMVNVRPLPDFAVIPGQPKGEEALKYTDVEKERHEETIKLESLK